MLPAAIVFAFIVLWSLLGFWWSLAVLAMTAIMVGAPRAFVVLATIFVIGGIAYLLLSGSYGLLLSILELIP